jgi:hypothetical protein
VCSRPFSLTRTQSEYEKLASRIENADEESLVRRGAGEFAKFVGADRRDHPTIIKVATNLSFVVGRAATYTYSYMPKTNVK